MLEKRSFSFPLNGPVVGWKLLGGKGTFRSFCAIQLGTYLRVRTTSKVRPKNLCCGGKQSSVTFASLFTKEQQRRWSAVGLIMLLFWGGFPWCLAIKTFGCFMSHFFPFDRRACCFSLLTLLHTISNKLFIRRWWLMKGLDFYGEKKDKLIKALWIHYMGLNNNF